MVKTGRGWATYGFCSSSALVKSHFFYRALYLDEIYILVPELDDTL